MKGPRIFSLRPSGFRVPDLAVKIQRNFVRSKPVGELPGLKPPNDNLNWRDLYVRGLLKGGGKESAQAAQHFAGRTRSVTPTIEKVNDLRRMCKPKVEMSPFYLRRMHSSPRRSRAWSEDLGFSGALVLHAGIVSEWSGFHSNSAVVVSESSDVLRAGTDFLRKSGARGAIPTRDLPLRRRTLYAAELREHR